MNPALVLSILIGGAALIGAGLAAALILSPQARAAMPQWPARDWRAMIALIGTIAGAAVLTWFVWWLTDRLFGQGDRLVTELVRDKSVRAEVGQVLVVIMDVLAWGLKLALAGVIAVLLSLGLAINRRVIRLSKTGFEASGGDGEEPPPIPVEVKNQPDQPVPVDTKPEPPAADESKLPPYARTGK